MLAWLWTRLSEGGPRVSISGRALRGFPEREIDRLLRARVLIEQPKADTWSVCQHCDCNIDARPIRTIGGELRACCPHHVAEDVVLDVQDIRRFALDADALAAQIAGGGGLAGPPSRIAEGLWLLGTIPSGAAVTLCSTPDALDAPGAVLAMRSAVRERPVIMIISEPEVAMTLRLREAGVQLLSIADVLRPGSDARDRLVIAPAPESSDGVRLVIRRSAQAAVLDGNALDLPMQRFVLLAMLARQVSQRDPVLLAETIERELRREPREIVRDLRAALTACGLGKPEADALIRTVRGRGYRLGLDPGEVAVEA